jgi:hypothetical protein
MSILDKILRRRGSHEEWLANHPGKETTKNVPPPAAEGAADRMRASMEAEMRADGDRSRAHRDEPPTPDA